MDSIKGFSKREIEQLAAMAEGAKENGMNLSDVFERFAAEHKRAKGSVRNFYYEFVRMCAEDEVLRAKYFKHLPTVSRAEMFDDDQARFLIRKILIGKQNNKSVRRTILELANGDEKLALRYQNKYRNLRKNKGFMIESVAKDLGAEEQAFLLLDGKKIPPFTVRQLKASINALVEKIALGYRTENQNLKQQVQLLQQENEILKRMLP